MAKKMDACRQDGDRTHDLSLIRRMLYPTELLGDDAVRRRMVPRLRKTCFYFGLCEPPFKDVWRKTSEPAEVV